MKFTVAIGRGLCDSAAVVIYVAWTPLLRSSDPAFIALPDRTKMIHKAPFAVLRKRVSLSCLTTVEFSTASALLPAPAILSLRPDTAVPSLSSIDARPGSCLDEEVEPTSGRKLH